MQDTVISKTVQKRALLALGLGLAAGLGSPTLAQAQALSRAIKQPQLVAKIEAAGTELHAGSAQEVLAWTQRDTDKWSRVIKEAQIAID
jgi:tripartite-type tricarboxylate transporter receptor subunit TctC